MGLGPNTDQPLSDYHSDGKQNFLKLKKNCKKFAKKKQKYFLKKNRLF